MVCYWLQEKTYEQLIYRLFQEEVDSFWEDYAQCNKFLKEILKL